MGQPETEHAYNTTIMSHMQDITHPDYRAPEKSESGESGDYLDQGGIEKAESPDVLERAETHREVPFSEEDAGIIRRLASRPSSRPTLSQRASTFRSNKDLERKDTIAGLELDDPIFGMRILCEFFANWRQIPAS